MIKASLKRLKDDLRDLVSQDLVYKDFEYATHVFPRYIAPVVIADAARSHTSQVGLTLKPMHYGLVPFFEKSPKPKKVFHNARSETLSEKVTFKGPYKRTRCLVPMNGFLEYIWESDKEKWLAYFDAKEESHEILYAAGLWSRWLPPGADKNDEKAYYDNFAVITTEPPAFVRDIGHDRCPMFLKKTDDVLNRWLSPSEDDPEVLDQILKDNLNVRSISFRVEEMPVPTRASPKKAAATKSSSQGEFDL